MDKVVDAIAALGVPGIILLIAISATGLTGAAALTAALATLGPGGMLGGIALLGISGWIAKEVSEYGFEEIYKSVFEKLNKEKGVSKADILKKIDAAWITSGMKIKLKEHIKNL